MNRSRRVNVNLDMQGLSTVGNLPDAKDDADATPLRQVRAIVEEASPATTDLLAAYILAKS